MATAEIDDEKLVNGYKFSVLLVDFGTEALKNLLDSYILPPSTLATTLANKKKLLIKLNKKKILSKPQWDKLFPVTGVVDSKNFDISLLVLLLRNVFNLPAPKTGWDNEPCPTDSSLEAAVATLKWFRNTKHGHAVTSGLATPDFETYWKDVANALIRLGVDASKINQLKVQSVRRESWLNQLYKCNFTSDMRFLAEKYHEDTRTWVFKQLENWFQRREPNASLLVLVAEAGMGKSVIAAEFGTRKESEKTLAASHFFQYGNKLRQNPRIFIQSLARMLCENVPNFEEILTDHASSIDITDLNLAELFTLLLQEPANMICDPGHNVLILIDALDECESEEVVDIVADHFHKLPMWMKCLVTTRPQNTIEQKLKCLKLEIDASSEENLRDINKLLEKQLQEFEVSEEYGRVISLLTNQSEGLMLYVHFIVESVKQRTLKLTDVCKSFPKGIASVYLSYFKRLEKSLNVEKQLFTKFLEALAAATGVLPVSIATRILKVDSEEKVEDSVSALLPIRYGCVQVFHKSVVDWLSSEEIYGTHEFSVSVIDGHQVLAGQCEHILQRLKKREEFPDNESPEVSYALQYGIQHMLNVVGQRDKLYRFSCDLEIVYAKLRSPACSVYSIIDEMALVMQSTYPGEVFREMEDYMRCLKRHPYILAKNPKMIFQLMANEADSASTVLEANVLGKKPKYRQDVWFQLVNRDQFQSPIVSRYHCSKKVNCCDVSPDKTLAVCGCEEGVVILWSLESGKELWLKNDRPVDAWPDDERCNYCVFLPHLSSSSYSRPTHNLGIIHGRLDQMYDIDGKRHPLFPGNTYTFIDSCFSPNGRYLLTRDSHITSRIILWDLHDGNAKRAFEEESESITCCTFSRCGRFVISGSFSTGLSVWDTSAVHDRRARRYSNPILKPSNVHCITCTTRDSQYLLLCTSDNSKVMCFKLTGGELGSEVQLDMQTQSRSWWLGVPAEGTCLYVRETSQTSEARLPFDVRNVPVSNACLRLLTDIDDTRVIMTSSNALYVYRTITANDFLTGTKPGIRALRYSLEGDIIYASSDEGLLMYEASTGKFIRNDRRLHGITSFCLTLDGQHLLLRRGKAIRVCEAMTTEVVKNLELPPSTQDHFLCFEDYLLGFSKFGEMQIWNLNSGDLLAGNECHSAFTACCDIAPRIFDRVISCDVQGEMILTNLKEREIVEKTHTNLVICCKFSPDGRQIATGDAKGTLQLWNGFNGKQLCSTHAHSAAITSCTFLNQDSHLVFTGSVDGTLRAWSVEHERLREAGFMSFEEKIRDIASSSCQPQITVALRHRIAVVNIDSFRKHHQRDVFVYESQCVLL